MTWKEIKDEIESQGVEDNDIIDYIFINQPSKLEDWHMDKLENGWSINNVDA